MGHMMNWPLPSILLGHQNMMVFALVLSTGRLSPVIIDSSIVVWPFIIVPSTGILHPDFTTMESRSKKKTSEAIEKLMNLMPSTAVVLKDEQEVVVNIEDVQVGVAINVSILGLLFINDLNPLWKYPRLRYIIGNTRC